MQAWNRSQTDGPELQALDARLGATQQQIGNQNEAGLRTELAQLNTRIGNQDKRVQRGIEVQNLQQLPVPKLSAGILPVAGRAA